MTTSIEFDAAAQQAGSRGFAPDDPPPFDLTRDVGAPRRAHRPWRQVAVSGRRPGFDCVLDRFWRRGQRDAVFAI